MEHKDILPTIERKGARIFVPYPHLDPVMFLFFLIAPLFFAFCLLPKLCVILFFIKKRKETSAEKKENYCVLLSSHKRFKAVAVCCVL